MSGSGTEEITLSYGGTGTGLLEKTGANAGQIVPLSSVGRNWLNLADAIAQRSALLLGSAALSATGDFAPSSHVSAQGNGFHVPAGGLPASSLAGLVSWSQIDPTGATADDVGAIATSEAGTSLATLSGGKLTASQIPASVELISNRGVTYPELIGGKIPLGQLPSIPTGGLPYAVADQAARLALNVSAGSFAIQADVSKTYALAATPATNPANWLEILFPTSPVQSVFGRTGPVTAQTGDYTAAQVGAEPAFSVLSVAKGGTGLSGVAADRFLYSSSTDTFSVGTITSFARTLLDDTSAAIARVTLGLGTIATEDASAPVHIHTLATTSTAGFMAAADKSKLDGIAASATANQTDAFLLNRTNHTGTQAHTTITGLGTAATAATTDFAPAVHVHSTFTLSVAGFVPAPGAGASDRVLRSDGSWSAVSGGTGGGSWGSITGTLSAQTDLQAALDARLTTIAATITTTNATPTEIASIPIAANTYLCFDAIVLASGNDGNWLRCDVKQVSSNQGGTLTDLPDSYLDIMGAIEWDVTVESKSGPNRVAVVVTGAASVTINWAVQISNVRSVNIAV